MRVYFTWELNKLHARPDVPQIRVNEPSVTDPGDVEKTAGCPPPIDIPNPTVNCGGGRDGRRKSSVASPNRSPIPKVPPRSKSKDNRDKEKDKGKTDESVKLLGEDVVDLGSKNETKVGEKTESSEQQQEEKKV